MEARLFPEDIGPLAMRMAQFQGIAEEVILQESEGGVRDSARLLPVREGLTSEQIQNAIEDLSGDVIPELEKQEHAGIAAGFQRAVLDRAKGYEQKLRETLAEISRSQMAGLSSLAENTSKPSSPV